MTVDPRSEELKIDLDRFEEISHSFIEKLSGEKVLTIDIYDQDGGVALPSGRPIVKEDVAAMSGRGVRFFIPRRGEEAGRYDYQIVSKDALRGLAENTASTYSAIRATGAMTYEQYVTTHRDLMALVSGLKNEDRYGGVLGLLKDINDFDYYTYVHSVNVGVLAMIYQHKTSYGADKIKTMSMAGYLHDIGKLRVPRDVIDKPGPLTKEEIVRMLEHTREGYRILADMEKYSSDGRVSDIVKYGALFHHRKYRIHGYPARQERDGSSSEFYRKLPEEVRIIGICDVYDALTTSTPWRTACDPRTALRYILNLSNYHFAVNDVHLFLKALGLSLNAGKDFITEGSFVMLEVAGDGGDRLGSSACEFARVLETFRGRPMYPRVRIFYDATRNQKRKRIEVDLRSDNYRKIVRLVENPRMTAMLRKLELPGEG